MGSSCDPVTENEMLGVLHEQLEMVNTVWLFLLLELLVINGIVNNRKSMKYLKN